MWWLFVPVGLIVGAWLFGPIKVVVSAPSFPPPPPVNAPRTQHGETIQKGEMVLVDGMSPAFRDIVKRQEFPTDLGPFVPLGTTIGSTLTFRVLNTISTLGADFVLASVDDPRISLPGVFNIPVASIVQTMTTSLPTI